MSVPARVQQGSPTGGQFAAAQRGEADVDLSAARDGQPTASQQSDSSVEPGSLEDTMQALDAESETLYAASGNVENLTCKALAQNLRGRWPSATHLDFYDGDQDEDDLSVGELRDADGNDLGLDTYDDDEVGDLVINLRSTRLQHRDDVEVLGTRNNPIYRLDLTKAEAIATPARSQ